MDIEKRDLLPQTNLRQDQNFSPFAWMVPSWQCRRQSVPSDPPQRTKRFQNVPKHQPDIYAYTGTYIYEYISKYMYIDLCICLYSILYTAYIYINWEISGLITHYCYPSLMQFSYADSLWLITKNGVIHGWLSWPKFYWDNPSTGELLLTC